MLSNGSNVRFWPLGLKKTNLDIANWLTIKYCVVNKGMLRAIESIDTINAHK